MFRAWFWQNISATMHAYETSFLVWMDRRSLMAAVVLPLRCWAQAFQKMQRGSEVFLQQSWQKASREFQQPQRMQANICPSPTSASCCLAFDIQIQTNYHWANHPGCHWGLFIIYQSMNMINKLFRSRALLARPAAFYGDLIYTNDLQAKVEFDKIPTFRAFDLQGKLLSKSIKYDCEKLSQILKTMIFVDEMDDILLKVKGQGKISFYMTSFGEHACIVGSAAALSPEDWVYTQYREQGAHIWRGFTIQQIINQCIGNSHDGGKGRQMPVHYGSKQLNNVTVSSPLTTQVPQAAGTGYGFRTANEQKVAACYLGEGAASEGDFPTALNFAATLRSQTLFLCRNNKFAISTPTEDQYACDGIIPRAVSFAIASSRVDGNDALACYEATRFARDYILKNKKPYFLEFMTYRVGDHSTSDNSSMYRKEEERNQWKANNNPITRLTKFLKNVGHADIPNEEAVRSEAGQQVKDALRKCMKTKFSPVETLFDDVYDRLPAHLVEQREQLREHLRRYGDKYEFLDKFEK